MCCVTTEKQAAERLKYTRVICQFLHADELVLKASLHVYDGSSEKEEAAVSESAEDVKAVIAELESEMITASGKLEFERAAVLLDQIDTCVLEINRKRRSPNRKKPTGCAGEVKTYLTDI